MVDARSRLATEIIAAVLCTPRSDEDASHGRLRVIDASLAAVQDLLPLLTDVRVEEWLGESGTRYREYIGRLESGLTLVIQTDADLVPAVNVPEGGA